MQPLTSSQRPRLAILAATFDPPTLAHRALVQQLLQHGFDRVIICPIEPDRERGQHEQASARHRAALATLGFRDLDRLQIDYTDLSERRPTDTRTLLNRYSTEGDPWFVVEIGDWNELQSPREANYVVTHLPHTIPNSHQLPAQHMLLAWDQPATSADLRAWIYQGQSVASHTVGDVAEYIARHRLFVPFSGRRICSFRLTQPRVLMVYDDRNERSRALANFYAKYVSSTPNLILVMGGDGTMLHAIREHWRLRLPFLGLNTGHLGFLMNERLDAALDGLALVSYSLPLLRVDAQSAAESMAMELAFSDVWMERAEGQAAWIRVDVDERTRLSKVVGDGILVATAAGSSAYARAMGAVPVPIDTPTLALVGSNIFQPRFWKPMALSDSSSITLASLDYSGKRPVRGFVDGKPLGLVQELRIRQSLTASVELAFTTEFDPSARLLRSLFPPEEPQ